MNHHITQVKYILTQVRSTWKRTPMWENVPSDIYSQQKLKSAYAFVQSDQNSSLVAWRNFVAWLFKMHQVKILIRLPECESWSKSSLGAHVLRYNFWCCSSNCSCTGEIESSGHMIIWAVLDQICIFFQPKFIICFLISPWKNKTSCPGEAVLKHGLPMAPKEKEIRTNNDGTQWHSCNNRHTKKNRSRGIQKHMLWLLTESHLHEHPQMFSWKNKKNAYLDTIFTGQTGLSKQCRPRVYTVCQLSSNF